MFCLIYEMLDIIVSRLSFEVTMRLFCGCCSCLAIGGHVASVLACCHDRTAAVGAVSVGWAAGFLGWL